MHLKPNKIYFINNSMAALSDQPPNTIQIAREILL